MRKKLIWAGIAVAVVILGSFILALSIRPRVKTRVEQLLSKRFDSGVSIGHLSITLLPKASVSAADVKLFYKHRVDAPPLIEIKHFVASSDIPSLLFGATRMIDHVQLTGLRITIPRGVLKRDQMGPRNNEADSVKKDRPAPILINKIVADGTVLQVLPKDPRKEPLEWNLEKLTLTSAGRGKAMSFVAALTNAKPPGRIQTTGSFGPWEADEPGATPLSGDYDFRNADLSVFNGISGILASTGSYSGALNRIEARGATDTPDFQVGKGMKVDLKTTYSATIDGTSGDTYLHPVDATLLNSEFICNGGVYGTPPIKGKRVDLDVAARKARMEDILNLVMAPDKGKALLVGDVNFKSKLVIPQGKIPVMQKLYLNGNFSLRSGRFTSDKVQDKLDLYSNRSSRQKRSDVASNIGANFVLDHGTAELSGIHFSVPGINVLLNGTYGLVSEKIDMKGRIELQGSLSNMTTGWRSLLLKPMDPLFHREGKGAVIPIGIGGTKSEPKFGASFPKMRLPFKH